MRREEVRGRPNLSMHIEGGPNCRVTALLSMIGHSPSVGQVGHFPDTQLFYSISVLSASELSEDGFPSETDLKMYVIARSTLRIAMRKLSYQVSINAKDL
jgi:hypothetical protein